MADDLLGGVFGGEDESSESVAPESLTGAEAFAAAVAAIASRQDPEVARRTAEFLSDQSRLLRTQAQHLEDEHASRLVHLRLTVSAAKRKRFADYMRNALYACIALLALGVLAAMARMTFEAMSDHSLVVEDFTVPSDFAARGMTSQALAEDLASRVEAIRATANQHSASYSSDVRADQAAALRVQIPETSISIDELERFLHRWLGHETVVNGELREGSDGQISIVLHIAGADPIVVQGSSADLDHLMQATAERAFAIFDPVNNVVYLEVTGRPGEGYDAAVRYAQSASVAMSSRDRADAYALLANADPDLRRALSRALVAIDTDPRVLIAWMMAAATSSALGHDEAAVDFARKGLGTRRRDQPAAQVDNYSALIVGARILIDQAMGDFAAFKGDEQALVRASYRRFINSYTSEAGAAALLHDEEHARQDLTRALAAGPVDTNVLKARWEVSSAAGDWTQALGAAKALVADVQAQQSATPSSEFAARVALLGDTGYRPLLAYAEAMTGDTASATALISQTPTDCYLCVRMRARIAAVAGDAAGADRWFAEAVRQAPDLPMAYFEWGQVLLARGDLTGAARELSLAHDKGPHFADPLKAWGDVLVKQGRGKEAVAKYDEALKFAPAWAALKQARAAAAESTR